MESSPDVRSRGVPVDFGALLLVSFLLGFANAISHGSYSGPALALIAAALVLLTWRFVAGARGVAEPALSGRPVVFGLVMVALLSLPVIAFCDTRLIIWPRSPWHVGRAAEIASFLVLLTYVPYVSGKRRETERAKHLRFAALGALVLAAGLATLHVSPAPGIDVWDLQNRGALALLRGENPYVTVTVPDTDPENVMIIPYVYPPTALYAGVLGLVIGGDVRFAMLAAVMITGFALRSIARRSPLSLPSVAEDAPALFFWLTPVLCLVLELSWIDPIQIMLLSVAVAAHVGKRPVLTAIAFGIALSSKQSMFWLIPLSGFVLRFTVRQWLIMAGTAAALVFPFVLLDWRRLKYANFDFMTALPPRSDALCLAVWCKRTFHAVFPAQIAFLLSACTVGFASWKMRGSVSAFARSVALTYLVFFFFNKWAFANYYFLLTGLTALAAAAALHVGQSAQKA